MKINRSIKIVAFVVATMAQDRQVNAQRLNHASLSMIDATLQTDSYLKIVGYLKYSLQEAKKVCHELETETVMATKMRALEHAYPLPLHELKILAKKILHPKEKLEAAAHKELASSLTAAQQEALHTCILCHGSLAWSESCALSCGCNMYFHLQCTGKMIDATRTCTTCKKEGNHIVALYPAAYEELCVTWTEEEKELHEKAGIFADYLDDLHLHELKTFVDHIAAIEKKKLSADDKKAHLAELLGLSVLVNAPQQAVDELAYVQKKKKDIINPLESFLELIYSTRDIVGQIVEESLKRISSDHFNIEEDSFIRKFLHAKTPAEAKSYVENHPKNKKELSLLCIELRHLSGDIIDSIPNATKKFDAMVEEIKRRKIATKSGK